MSKQQSDTLRVKNVNNNNYLRNTYLICFVISVFGFAFLTTFIVLFQSYKRAIRTTFQLSHLYVQSVEPPNDLNISIQSRITITLVE